MRGTHRDIHLRSAFVGGVVAALAVMTLPAVAAEVGDALRLGQTNTVAAPTVLKGPVGSANLRVVNTNPGGSPLSLFAEPGNPPLKVNSNTKVAKLNADRVDGLSPNQMLRVAHAATNNVDEAIFGGGSSADVLTVTVDAPRPGFIVMNAMVDGFGFGTVFDSYACRLTVDDVFVTGTLIASQVSSSGGEHTLNTEENCSTTGVQAVTSGTHTVDFEVLARESVSLSRASMWALYVPFDGQGKKP